TTGDFVARIISGNGIASTAASTGEATAHTLSVDLVPSAVASATTGSFSGLEFVSGDLTLLQGCTDNQILKWDDTLSRWQCQVDEDAGATATLQSVYNTDADGSVARITLTSADDSLVFINPAAAGTDSGTMVFIDQNDATGVTALGIDSEGTDDYAVEIRHQGDGTTPTEAALA